MAEDVAETSPPTADVARQGGVVAGFTGLSRLSGLARDVALSHVFGASGTADAFFVAFRIPNFFRRLTAEGAFAQAFVPVLSSFQREPREELQRFVAATMGNFTLVLTLVTVLGVLGATGLVYLFAPGFADDVARFAVTAELVRFTFPYLAFISLAAFAGSLLNSVGRFAVPAASPVLLNLVLVIAAIGFVPVFGSPGHVLAVGVLIAGVIQLLFHLPSLKRADLLFAPRLDWRHRGVREMLRLMVPAVLAASVNQLNALIGSVLASLLAVGSVSWLYYADRIMELPVGLVAIALGTVLLPSLSRLHAGHEIERFRAALDWGIRVALLLAVPAAVGAYLLAGPLISAVFLHGEMTAADARQAALALEAFTYGLIPLVLTKVLAPAFFSRHDTKTPFRYASISVAVNIAASLALVGVLAHVGLALATSIAAGVHVVLLARGLLRDGTLSPSVAWLWLLLKIVIASAAMVLAITFVQPDVSYWIEGRWLDRAGSAAGLVLLGAAVYLVAIFLLGVRPGDVRHRV